MQDAYALSLLDRHDCQLQVSCTPACRGGTLAYSPAEAPARDHFFQYTWIIPGIFKPKINLREHRYFGSPQKVSARLLFGLWASARSCAALQPYYQRGVISEDEVRASLAAYRSNIRITAFFVGESE